MAVVRIYYKSEDEFGFTHFNEDISLEEAMGKPTPEEFNGWNVKYINSDDKPDIAEPCKMYFDTNLDKISVDENWEVKIMPSSVFANKKIKKSQDVILEESIKNNPDSNIINSELANIEIAKKIGKGKNNDKMYLLALKGLDERVANGESDKPIIRQKLEAKIAEISGSTPDMIPGDKKNADPK